ncbi:uncharacterized protein HD556DRAFT_1310227 [Suillus plorans]|uniref:Uncharacterized protein n=1 Tax=Suillus plorans TaxID=116603 RepID=A0A9P7DEG6_9AGAM|nr:uncharacterized protein HD556DRAFT_1310227 [Suillus plorans]KAG1790893.1 hypothetical protein HD556DRAFT_1310227 [Suillus plorans]
MCWGVHSIVLLFASVSEISPLAVLFYRLFIESLTSCSITALRNDFSSATAIVFLRRVQGTGVQEGCQKDDGGCKKVAGRLGRTDGAGNECTELRGDMIDNHAHRKLGHSSGHTHQ